MWTMWTVWIAHMNKRVGRAHIIVKIREKQVLLQRWRQIKYPHLKAPRTALQMWMMWITIDQADFPQFLPRPRRP